MKTEDIKVFTVALSVVAEMFKEELSETIMVAYFDDLADYDLEDVMAALAEARRTQKYFPRVAVLRELASAVRVARRRALAAAQQAALPAKGEAFDPETQKIIRRDVRALTEALAARFGGGSREKPPARTEPTAEELAAHAARVAAAKERFWRVIGQTPPAAESAATGDASHERRVIPLKEPRRRQRRAADGPRTRMENA